MYIRFLRRIEITLKAVHPARAGGGLMTGIVARGAATSTFVRTAVGVEKLTLTSR